MKMSKTTQYNEYINLSNLKPEISSEGIYFPISVEHVDLNEYDGDARSFGYNYDDGDCTVVTYEQVVGTLAEDTIEMIDECAEMKKFMKKPTHSILETIESDLTCNTNDAELIIRYDSFFFYKDANGFFFKNEYYCNGTAQRVSDETAEIYREVNKEYQRKIVLYNKMMKEAIENVELLRTTLES